MGTRFLYEICTTYHTVVFTKGLCLTEDRHVRLTNWSGIQSAKRSIDRGYILAPWNRICFRLFHSYFEFRMLAEDGCGIGVWVIMSFVVFDRVVLERKVKH